MAAVYKLSPATLRRERAAGEPVPGDVVAGRLELAGLGAGIVFFFGVIVFASLRYGPDIDWTQDRRRLPRRDGRDRVRGGADGELAAARDLVRAGAGSRPRSRAR